MQPKLDLHLAKPRKLGTLQGIHFPATTNPFIFRALTLKMYVAGTTRSGLYALPCQAPKAWPDGLSGKQFVHPCSKRHGLPAETIRPAGAYVNLGRH
jgi:hypothetical protein